MGAAALLACHRVAATREAGASVVAAGADPIADLSVKKTGGQTRGARAFHTVCPHVFFGVTASFNCSPNGSSAGKVRCAVPAP